LENPYAVIFRELKEKETELEDARSRLLTIFMEAPIRIWEEDYSEVKREIDSLRLTGIKDFRKYFRSHPEAVRK